MDDEVAARRARELVDALRIVKEPGLGYAGAYSGNEFLPYPGSGQMGMLLLQQAAPQPSATLGALVSLGVQAVPTLVACLDDARPTAIKPMSALMWMLFSNEYDWNRRTERAPLGLVEDTTGPDPYRVLVGDLCFVALGQIFNRSFNAVRYQPTGGLVVNSPVQSSALRQVLVARFGPVDRESHRSALIHDFREPDGSGRRVGAALRLSFYYPEALDELVPGILQRPTYDVFAANSFARKELYAERDPVRQRELFDGFLRKHGPAGRTGLERQLFNDLNTLEADERGGLTPRLTEFSTQPRELLIALYGYSSAVRASDQPYPEYLEHYELASLVNVLQHDSSQVVDQAVWRLMTTTQDVNIALACMPRLAVHGYEEDVRRTARRLLDAGTDKNKMELLRKVLTKDGRDLVTAPAGNPGPHR